MEEVEENFKRQQEEIEALSSIYEENFILDSESSFTVIIREGKYPAVTLSVSLPQDYPSNSPPTYQKSAPFLRGEEKLDLCNQLEEIYLQNLGESLVFLWAEHIRTFLQERQQEPEHAEGETGLEIRREEVEELELEAALRESTLTAAPDVITGDVIQDRKSVFQGHAATVKSADEVKAVLAKLYQNKKVAAASHNIYAYRIFCPEKGTWLQDCEDDGEDAAGGRLLHLLEIVEARDTLVVVSRWYGGIHLGPDRFKHINNSARQVLELAGVIQQKEDGKKKKKGR